MARPVVIAAPCRLNNWFSGCAPVAEAGRHVCDHRNAEPGGRRNQ
ncbi:MAG: hypothetical protein U0992_23395 [Planctomycetaceae bacterium]